MADDDLGIDEGKSKKKTSKTTWIYIGLAAGGLLLTYLIYEHSKSSGSGSSSSSVSNPVGGTPVNPGAEIAVPTAASTYQPGTEMQAYQQGIQDALSIVQAQQGTGAEASSSTTPSVSSGSGTSSETQPVTTTPVTTTQVTTTSPYVPPSEPYIPASQPTTTSFTQPNQPVLAQYGHGFAPANISDRNIQIGGVTYHWISNPATAQADLNAGEQLYYMPSPYTIIPMNSGALGGPTPLYVEE